MNPKLIPLAAVVVVSACSTGRCPSKRGVQQDVAEQRNQETANLKSTFASGEKRATVKVARPDGSLKCGMGRAIPLDLVAQQLKGIEIISKQTTTDGMMRAEVCGNATGMVHVFEIPSDKLQEALDRGFEKFRE